MHAMNPWIKYPLHFIAAVVGLLLLCLALLPSMSPYLIKEFSPRLLQSTELSVKNLSINYYHGRIELSDLVLKRKQTPAFELKTLTIDIDLAALWRKQLKIEKLHAKQGHISVRQGQNNLFVAEINLGGILPSKTQKDEKGADKTSSWSSSLQDVSLRDFIVTIESSALDTQLIVKHASLDSILFSPENQQQLANSKLFLELEFNNSQTHHPQQPLTIANGLTLKSEFTLKGQLPKPNIEGSGMIGNLVLGTHDIKLLDVKQVNLAHFLIELSNQKNGSIAAAIDGLTLNDSRVLKSNKKSENAIEVKQFRIDHINFDKHRNSLRLGEVLIKDSNIQLDINEDRNIAQFVSIQSLAASYQEKKDSGDETQQRATKEQNEAEPLTFTLEKLLIEKSNINIIDHSIKPLVSHNIKIKYFQAGPYQSTQQQQNTKMQLSATLNQQALFKAQVTLTQQQPKLSLTANYQLSNFDLTAESSYLDATTGYFIHTGQLNSQAQISIDAGILDTAINLKIRAIELQRTNQEKSQRLDTSLQLPLDTTLSLLRDGNGDIDLKLPIQGDINSPEFNINDAIQQISRKALTEASLLYLQQAFQPYGALISVGSWLHNQSKKIRLDPILFNPGSNQLNTKEIAYIDKLGELLDAKQSLRIKVCPIIGLLEQQWLDQQTEVQSTPISLEQISDLRVKALQQYLVEKHHIEATQIIACKPQYQASSKPEASYLHLEI